MTSDRHDHPGSPGTVGMTRESALGRLPKLVIASLVFIDCLAGEAHAQVAVGIPSPSPTPIRQARTAATERIIVTGSAIPTSEEVGPNPIQTLDRDYIEKSGERTIEQLLRNLPVANANGVPTSNNASGSTPGAASISLRGLGPSATLVLMDGRRVAPYPVGGGGSATQSFIDLNSIPADAIATIEILKDGASTRYGADAVAGVVNIKLRNDYRGAEATIEYGNTFDKESSEFRTSLIFGAGDANTSVSGVMNYYHRNAIFAHDRGFSNNTFIPSSSSNPGNFQVSRAAVLAGGVSPDLLPDSDTFFAVPPSGTNGLTSPSEYMYSTRRLSFFNFNLFAGSLPESERYGGLVAFDHKVFSNQLVLYGNVLYQNVRTRNELAASATGSFQSPDKVPIAIPPHAPGATLGGPTYEETGVPSGAYNPFNPFQQILSGGSRYRLAEFGNRIIFSTTDAFLSTLGVQGDKLFDGSWGYDSGLRYSEVRDTETGTFESQARLDRILNAADPIFNPASHEYIGTTVPYNPFGDYRVPIPSNKTSIKFATVHPKGLNVSKLGTADFNIYTTSLFILPAGGVGFAVGGQFRREQIEQDPDQLNVEGDVVGANPIITTKAGRRSYGLFGEATIPFFSPLNSRAGFYALDFTASARFEYYNNNKTNILVPKLGVRWQPWDETFTVRSTWGEGFREPSLFELYASSITTTQVLTDPLTRLEDEIPVRVNSNPNLQPEDSRNFTAGIVYSPKFAPGLTFTVDLYDIERHDVVSAPDPNDVLKRESQGKLLPGEEVLRDNTGTITEVIEPYENNGGETARGFDFGLVYQLQTPFGIFTTQTDVTWLESFLLSITRGAPAKEVRSQSTGFGEGTLEWKGRSRLDWTWQGFDVNATVSYVDGYREVKPDGSREHWVQQTWIIDGQASYDFTFVPPVEVPAVPGYSKNDKGSVQELPAVRPWKRILNNTTLTIGCNNIFGQDPPKAYESNAGYADFLYDSTGRFVYISLKKTF